MKRNLKTAVVLAASSLIAATSSALIPQMASASLPTQVTTSPLAGRTLQLNYCWSSTVARPTCPRTSLPFTANGTINNMPGSTWVDASPTLTVEFVNPTASVTKVVYAGTRNTSTTGICLTGTMTATRLLQPTTMTGAWSGCVV